MSEHGRLVVVLGLVLSSLWLVLSGPPRAEPPGPWEPWEPGSASERCEVAVEQAEGGVRCLDGEEAERRGLASGDRLIPDGGVGRMAPERLALFASPVDLNGAPLEELESLPGVGRRLAERIVAARPFSSVEELGRVPGVGARRLRSLKARLFVEPVPDGGAL